MTPPAILIIDDDKELQGYLSEYLEARGAKTTACSHANLAMPFLEKNKVDICILDVNMPALNGFDLARQIREIHPNLPFLFLSGQNGKNDRIQGLKLGADDYITKPFSLEELFLRIQNILHRYQQKQQEPEPEEKVHKSTIGHFVVNWHARTLEHFNQPVKLSEIECQILKMLCDSKNELVPRETIIDAVWGTFDEYKSRSLNVYIAKLRKCLSLDKQLEILNVHGRGYKLICK
jgi:two-component system, OmpR family, response regulator